MHPDEMESMLALLRQSDSQAAAVGEGVVFLSEASARNFSEQHDKDLVQIGAGWLAKNRATTPGPMPTKDGDIVVHHLHQLFRVWIVTKDGSQKPDRNVGPLEVWSRSEAEEAARTKATETGGQIFWLQTDYQWVKIPR